MAGVARAHRPPDETNERPCVPKRRWIEECPSSILAAAASTAAKYAWRRAGGGWVREGGKDADAAVDVDANGEWRRDRSQSVCHKSEMEFIHSECFSSLQ